MLHTPEEISNDIFGVFILIVIACVLGVISLADKRKYHMDRLHKATSVLYRRRKKLKEKGIKDNVQQSK